MVLETRLYDILHVLSSASNEEISKGYKKLALKCHPDKTNRDPVLTEMFKDVTRAYEVLKDTELRRVYDHYGEAGLDGTAVDATASKQTEQPVPAAPSCGLRKATHIFSQVFNDINSAFEGGAFPSMGMGMGMGMNMNMNMNMMNMMNMTSMGMNMDAGGMGSSSRPPLSKTVQPVPNPDREKVTRGNDIHHVCNVTLWELYKGKVVKFRLPKNSTCKVCVGNGGFNPKLCISCEGHGQVLITLFNDNSQFQELLLCRDCRGTGIYYSPRDTCPNCIGEGYVKENKIIKANIFPGSKHEDRIILQGEGDEGRNIVPGDVIIHLQEIAQNRVVRRCNDLFIEHDIDLKTALLGGKTVVHDFMKPGQDLQIYVNVHGYAAINNKTDKNIQSGEVCGVISNSTPKIIKNLGMPINEASIEGSFYQNADEVEDFSDVIFDLKRYKRGNLFIKFNVMLPTLDDFANKEQDFAILQKILLGKQIEDLIEDNIISSHLSNIPDPKSNEMECPINEGMKKKKIKRSESFLENEKRAKQKKQEKHEYDYNDIEVDSTSGEEREDEAFFKAQWDDDNRKRKLRMDDPLPDVVEC